MNNGPICMSTSSYILDKAQVQFQKGYSSIIHLWFKQCGVESHQGCTSKSNKKFDLSTMNNSKALWRSKYLQ
jgi:hypothetical protein